MENSEKNVFKIKSITKSFNGYILHGEILNGYFSINDYIKIKEKDFVILDGYINKIKLIDKTELSSTKDTGINTFILYISTQDNSLNLNKNCVVIKEQKILKM
jgi:hypothetical protein